MLNYYDIKNGNSFMVSWIAQGSPIYCVNYSYDTEHPRSV